MSVHHFLFFFFCVFDYGQFLDNIHTLEFPSGSVVKKKKKKKNLPANVGDIRDVGSIPGSERSSGGGNGNPLQYSHLKNSMDRGA